MSGSNDFKSFTEVWTAEGWLVTATLDYIKGTPDYKYSAVIPLYQYNALSLAGVPYGEDNSKFPLTKTIRIPSNAAATSFRTIISGWGHADNTTANGNCAEWCFRKHHIQIDENKIFEHNLDRLGCAKNNPVQPQYGNWQGNRAGWCPGMEIPIRIDLMGDPQAGKSIKFAYMLEPWTNNDDTSPKKNQAFYAISSFVVVKSNTAITELSVNK